MFWLTCIVLALVVAGFVVTPLLRSDTHSAASPDVALYKAQLAEVENDLNRGLIAPEEADRTRTEISRRLLAASKARKTANAMPEATSKILATTCTIAVCIASVGGYFLIGALGEPDQPLQQRLAQAQEMRENRPSQAEFEAVAVVDMPLDVPDDYLASVTQLREIVPTRPNDLKGWQLLARHETALRNFSGAAKAQSQIIRLSDGGEVDDLVMLADLMVAAAEGQVSPEAEAVVREILRRDPENIPARFYLGSMHNMTARPDIAFRLWRPIVENAPDSFHSALARAQIEGAAMRAGVDYTPPEVRGPTAEDIANADDMTEEDRSAMIGGMVSGLADRLATQGGPAQDWARLISAYGVLGETAAANEIYKEALTAFASDDFAIGLLQDAAEQAGISQ